MKLKEVRKEDNIYYQGAFWIIGDTVKNIKRGKFTIRGIQIPSNYDGEYLRSFVSKASLTHKRLWSEYSGEFNDKPWNYFPRGRVAIYKGTAYVHLNSLFNQPDIIDEIIERYKIEDLEIEIDLNDTYQGSHYDFLLE